MPAPEVIDDFFEVDRDWMPEIPQTCQPVPAAVLIALVAREDFYTVLYTERSSGLRAHSGQVAFPGGKIEPDDAGPAAAALREAEEEVELKAADTEILGYLPSYYTGTNYLITPVVAAVKPGAPFKPDPCEVSDLFEVPLALLARAESYTTRHVERHGVTHSTWQVTYQGHMIWGITGNLTRRFFEMALKEIRV
jgi:8-oxo-dGTP pyrophosphatase MutT (NUDIX family)